MKRLMKILAWALTWGAMIALTLGVIGFVLVTTTDIVPANWNPRAPLDLRDEVTPVTRYKLRAASVSKGACMRALENSGVGFVPLEDFTDSDPRCGIERRIKLTSLPSANIGSLEMDCALALRLTLWDQHSVQPTAQRIYNQGVASYQNLGTYNCREIRTSSGSSGRMSKHATARAVDISGFTFENGQRANLIDDWDDDEFSAFLKIVNKGACPYFGVVLGPSYNALHANHFHLDLSSWQACR